MMIEGCTNNNNFVQFELILKVVWNTICSDPWHEMLTSLDAVWNRSGFYYR